MGIIDNDLFTQTNPNPNSPRNNPSLAGQLTNLNNEINSIEETLVEGYVRESASVSYVSSSSFTVSGDVTAIYTNGRIVRFSNGTTGIVSSSSYSSTTAKTTVTMLTGTVPSSLSYVDIAIQARGLTSGLASRVLGDNNVVVVSQKDSNETERNILNLNSSNDLEIGGAGISSYKLNNSIIKPSSDSTSAIRITKANGTTTILNINSTNERVGIRTPTPLETFQIGNVFGFHTGGNCVISFGWSPFLGETLMSGFPAEIRWSPSDGYLQLGVDTTSRSAGQTPSIPPTLVVRNNTVGIGTTSPSTRLHLHNGRFRVSESDGPGQASIIELSNGTKINYIFTGSDGHLYARTDDTTKHLLLQAGTSSGYVGINTITPGYTLDVNGQCHASSFPTSSDKRFKENVKEIDNALEKVKKLRGVYFNWNKFYRETLKVDETEDTEIGLIAQEVKKVIPEVVTTFEREVDNKKEKYYSVEYARISALLINAIKELAEKVENLEKKYGEINNSRT